MSGIYLIQEGGQLVEMSETAYDSEALLQELLARYPSLLAGDQIDTAVPRKWLLISQELPLASDDGGAWRWSIDHVFLDQDSVPTLVEVKRSTDTRIRREVVGQMLDYAANAVVYLPIDRIRERFEARCRAEGLEPLEAFASALGVQIEVDERWEQFWEQAKTNLEAGKIRMVFVADKIPPELRRIVEFMNGQMNPAEVLAVEVKQYLGEGQRAMATQLLGQTAQAQQKKTSVRSPGRQWNQESFFSFIEGQQRTGRTAARRIFDWMEAVGAIPQWGKGTDNGSFAPTVETHGKRFRPITVSSSGRLAVNFATMTAIPPFDVEEKRDEFRHRLNSIEGVDIPSDGLNRWPSIDLEALVGDEAMQQFLDALEWSVQEVRSAR
jgi:hypothetical protein